MVAVKAAAVARAVRDGADGSSSSSQASLFDLSRLSELRGELLPPAGVVWVMCVGCAMAVWSFVMVCLPAPFSGAHEHERLLWVLNVDMFGIQNLGHGAFLIMFSTSWWRNRNVLALCMCQLSCLFLLFASLGYCLLAVQLHEHVSVLHHVVPGVFSLLLGVALVTCSQMASEFNLSVLRPGLYRVADADTTLRRVLLVQCVWQCAEPVLVAVARLSGAHADPGSAFVAELGGAPALTMRAFVETYTLGFHQAFVMATTFAQVLLEDRLKDRSAALMSAAGQAMLVLCFAVGGLTLPADALFFAGTCVKIATHALLSLLSLRLFVRLVRVQAEQRALAQEREQEQGQGQWQGREQGHEPSWQWQENTAHEAVSGSADKAMYAPLPREDSEGQQAVQHGAAFQGLAVWDAAFGQGSMRERYVGRLTLAAAFVHGACWQAQAMLSAWLGLSSQGGMERSNSLQAGLNFGMHGAGITVFVLVLALRSPASFQFLKLSVLLGALGGAAISLVQLYHLYDLASRSAKLEMVISFFHARAAAGLALGLVYALLEYPSGSARGSARGSASGSDASGSDAPAGSAAASAVAAATATAAAPAASSLKRAMLALALFWAALVAYSLAVTAAMGSYGARQGFFVMNQQEPEALQRQQHQQDGAEHDDHRMQMHPGGVDKWHMHRLIEFPPGYGLVFHFCYLLPGFAGHFFVQGFRPSKWIGVAFSSSAVLLLTFQAWAAAVLAPPPFAALNDLMVAANVAPVLAGAALIGVLLAYKPQPVHNAQFLTGDFWH